MSAEAALLAIGLLNHSDDEGYFNANPKLIESDVFPLRELSRSTTALLQELSSIGYLELFSGSDGKKYGRVVNFAKHQVINKPTPSKIKDLCEVLESYGSPPVVLPVGKERKGTGNREQGKEYTPTAVAVSADDKFEKFWAAYDYRIGKQKAAAAWRKIHPDGELADRIISGAELYSKANPTRTYYKHAATWLNGRNWEDDPADLVPKIARQQQPAKTQHQLNQEAIARSLGFLPRHDMKTVEGEVVHGQNPAGYLG